MLTRRSFHSGFGAALSATLLGAPAHAAVAVPQPQAMDPAALGSAQGALAARLLATFAEDHAGTITLVSPMSAALSLSVIAMLGDEAMRRSLRRALQFGAAGEGDPFDAMLGQGRAVGARVAGSPLVTADLLMLDADTEPFAFTLDGLAHRAVEVTVGDLASGDAVVSANAWVKARTHGLIPAILDAPPGRGGLVSLNALHFKDAWKTPFDIALSTTASFHPFRGAATPVRMMTGQGTYRVRQDGPLAAVDLPFSDPRFSLVLVSRTDQPADAAWLSARSGGWLGGAGFTTAKGEIGLPRLELAGSTDLLPVLTRLGFRNRPLPGLGARAPMLRSLSQRTVLTLDETGAEAAAATAALASRSVDDRFVKIKFDKPFIFALRDTATGLVILAGHAGTIPKAKLPA